MFVGKMPELIAELDVRRKNEKRNIEFREHFEQKYAGKKVEHLLAELGITRSTVLQDAWDKGSEARMLVSEMGYTAIKKGLRKGISALSVIGQDKNRLVTPEIVMDPIEEGKVQSSFYDRLVARTTPLRDSSATVPKLDLSDATATMSGEMARPRTGRVSISSKKVEIFKVSRSLEITYEAVRRHELDFVQLYFRRLGNVLGSQLNRQLTTISINGDQSDGTESAAVIGVKTANTLTYADVVRASTRMSLLNEPPTAILAGEEMGVEWQDNDAVKNRQSGDALINLTPQTPVVRDFALYTSPNMPNNQIQLISVPNAFVQLVEQPLLVETDRFIREQFYTTVASAYIGFMNFSRTARVIIDKSKQINFSTGLNYFPSWMNVV